MRARTVFCSACDRNVSLVPRSSDWIWRIVLATDAQGEVACLERGVRCTGTLCPFCAVLPEGGDGLEASRPGEPRPN
jgi:hypothetical protein